MDSLTSGFLSPTELVLRLVVATLLGGVLGFEREFRSKPAGLRTHMLVALGAACATLVAISLAEAEPRPGLDAAIRATPDPTRVMHGVLVGIGFLGGGAILRDHGSVAGLTTAGSIWLVGAVGVAAGTGEFLLAAVAVLLAVIVLAGLRKLEVRMPRDGGVERKDGMERKDG